MVQYLGQTTIPCDVSSDDVIQKLFKLKMISKEDDFNGRRHQWKTTGVSVFEVLKVGDSSQIFQVTPHSGTGHCCRQKST